MEPVPVTAGLQLRQLWGPALTGLIAIGVVALLTSSGGQPGVTPLALSRLAIDGGAVAIWALAALGLGAAILRVTRIGTGGIALAAGLGWGALGLATLGLGVVGWVGPPIAWGLLVAGLAAGAWAIQGRTMAVPPMGAASALGWGIGGVLLGIVLFLALFPAGLLWPTEPNGYDVLGYHLQIPREWYEARAITFLPHNVFSYMPLAMEIHYLLAMGLMADPWGGMYAAQLMHVAFWLAAAAAAYSLGHRIAGPAPGWAAAGVVAACPLALLLAPIAYNEGALVLYGLLVLRCLREAVHQPSDQWKWAAIAGVCGGLAAGAKLTAIPLWLVLPALGLALAIRPIPRALTLAATLLIAGLIPAAPWLVRTALHANGNPVFPVAARTLGSPGWDETRIHRFERAHAPREDQRTFARRAEAFWQQVLAAPEFAWVPVPAAVGLGTWALFRRRPMAAVWLLLLAGHFAVWLGLTHLQGRFWIPALPLMAALVAGGMSTGSAPKWLGLMSVSLSAVFAVGLVWTRLEPFRTPDGRLITEVVGVDFRAVEGLLIPPETLTLDEDATLTLVGDARAFAYRRPMDRLRYTYVFDAAGDSLLDAYRVQPGDWVLISPSELRRFGRTYFGFPPMPPAWESLPGPTLMSPADPRRRP